MEQKRMCSFIEDTVTQTKNRKFFQPDCDICGKPNSAQQLNGNEENDIRFGTPRWRIIVDSLTKKRYYACGSCHEKLRPGNKTKAKIIHWKEVLNQYG
mgnify:CR=1 FL=1